MIEKALRANDAQVAIGKILLRKLRPRGKVYVARSNRKSRRVLDAHFVLNVKFL